MNILELRGRERACPTYMYLLESPSRMTFMQELGRRDSLHKYPKLMLTYE